MVDAEWRDSRQDVRSIIIQGVNRKIICNMWRFLVFKVTK